MRFSKLVVKPFVILLFGLFDEAVLKVESQTVLNPAHS